MHRLQLSVKHHENDPGTTGYLRLDTYQSTYMEYAPLSMRSHPDVRVLQIKQRLGRRIVSFNRHSIVYSFPSVK